MVAAARADEGGRCRAGEQPRSGPRARHRRPVRGADAATLRKRPAHRAARHRRRRRRRCGEIDGAHLRRHPRATLDACTGCRWPSTCRTTVVLDDQLVQSDETRMDWFRALLAEKARSFQIVVFTCRPGDYLAASAMVRQGEEPCTRTPMAGSCERSTSGGLCADHSSHHQPGRHRDSL